MAKKNKIPKNRDIREMIGEKADKEETITMEEIISQMDKKQQEEKQRRKSFNKKIKNMATRKENEFAEEKRKTKYLKAIGKVQEKEGQEER